jgi:hypothetical protein
MELHPKIIAFWEQKGLIIKPRFALDGKKYMLWDAVNLQHDVDAYIIEYTVAQTHDTGETTYWFEDGSYSEEEMLRVIKLKAFL